MSDERCCMIIDAHPVARLGIRDALSGGDGWSFGSSPTAATRSRPCGTSAHSMWRSSRCVPPGADRRRARRRSRLCCSSSRGSASSASAAGSSATRSSRRWMPGRRPTSASTPPETMRSAVEAVADFESFIDPTVDRRGDGKLPITRRQRQILQLLADGCSTAEAAGAPRTQRRDRAHPCEGDPPPPRRQQPGPRHRDRATRRVDRLTRGRRRRSDPAALARDEDSLGAIGGADLAVDVVEVGPHRARGEPHLGGDLLVDLALGEAAERVDLAA